jgi:methyltransferase-like protein
VWGIFPPHKKENKMSANKKLNKLVECVGKFREHQLEFVSEMIALTEGGGTPLEHAIMGFVEIFEALLVLDKKDQVNVLKGINKFLELVPVPEAKNRQRSRTVAINAIKEFIEAAEEIEEIKYGVL